MKKNANVMDSIYVNRPSNLNESNKQKINYWCPTGMNPIMLN